MPYMPEISTLTANSAGIINTIRDNASADYRNAIPEVEDTTESIRMVGTQIMAFQPHMNEFINALVNRIAIVSITSRRYQNPMRWAKKGILENGETEEEIFVNAAQGMPYDCNDETLAMFKLYKGDVRSSFHSLNLQSVYPISINESELRLAFMSRDGVTDLIAKKVESLYSGLNYDEFILTKYIIARLALDGMITNQTIAATQTEADMKATITSVKGITNLFQFYSPNYNIAGVNNFTPVDNLYIMTTATFDASMDVNVLAAAFNMDRAQFIGRRTMVDSFALNANEQARLAALLARDKSFVPLDEGDNEALATIQCVALDESFFRIWDVTPDKFTEQYDALHLRWNEFLHAWRIYSASPFANVVMFSSQTPTVTTVTVNGPSTANAGDTVQFTASVSGSDFANKGVTWTITTTSLTAGTATINSMGMVKISEDAEGSFTVTATSAQDSSKTNTKTCTIN